MRGRCEAGIYLMVVPMEKSGKNGKELVLRNATPMTRVETQTAYLQPRGLMWEVGQVWGQKKPTIEQRPIVLTRLPNLLWRHEGDDTRCSRTAWSRS